MFLIKILLSEWLVVSLCPGVRGDCLSMPRLGGLGGSGGRTPRWEVLGLLNDVRLVSELSLCVKVSLRL